MSDKIYREIATQKSLLVSPISKRYALFCKPILENDPGVECSSKEQQGRLGEYDDSKTAEEVALAHDHPVLIRYKEPHQAKFYDH